MPDGTFTGGNLPEHLTEKELGWSWWWVNNREKVKKLAVTVFVIIDAALFIYGAWGITDWLMISGVKEELSLRQLASASYGVNGKLPVVQDIKIEEPGVFSGASGKYDVVIPVSNPNPRHWAYLEYRLTYGSKETPLRTGFVLPGQSKYLTELGLDSGDSADIRLKVEKMEFRLVDPHAIPDYLSWVAPRSDIQAINPVFTPAQTGGTAAAANTHFTIVNGTAFSYYDVYATVLLYRGDTPVAVNRAHFDELKAGESRDVDLYWYQNLPQVTRVDVLPDINFLDPKVYKAPGT